VENGANVNAKNNFGYTPLYIAAEGGHVSTVKFLLTNGADAEIMTNSGGTALSDALENLHTAVSNLLV
jgi:ankyrin repeat protein